MVDELLKNIQHLLEEANKKGHSIDIPFHMAGLQSLKMVKYKEMIKELDFGYKISYIKNTDHWDVTIKIVIVVNEFKKFDGSIVNHTYEINLTEYTKGDYCQCKPTDIGYDEISRCCGIDCDCTLPAFEVTKIETETIGCSKFRGSAKDLHTYRKSFEKEEELKKIVEELERIEDNIKYIKKQMLENLELALTDKAILMGVKEMLYEKR